MYSGGFRGGQSPLRAPFGRRTDAVTVFLISENGTVLWRVLNFDRCAVKRAIQNTQNDCHQWLSDICRVHQIRFLRPGPGWRSLQRSLDPSWFKGALLLREGGQDERRRVKREGKGMEG